MTRLQPHQQVRDDPTSEARAPVQDHQVIEPELAQASVALELQCRGDPEGPISRGDRIAESRWRTAVTQIVAEAP